MLLSDKNKILNDEQRRQRNNPQIKIDNPENSLFPKKNEMYDKCLGVFVYPVKTYICFLLQTKNGAKAHKRLINSTQADFII